MIGHVKKLAEMATSIKADTGHPLIDTVYAFGEAINDLDAMDFAPIRRPEFLLMRQAFNRQLKRFSPSDPGKTLEIVTFLANVLDHWGPLAQPPSRVFRWLSHPDLRTIVERDYVEVAKLTLPSGAWKSTVILAGSIIEAVLFDLLTKHAGRFVQAQASAKAKRQNGSAIPVEDWKLVHLIAIATDIKLMPAARAATFDQVLRDYRNFVHPTKELRAEHPCREGEALMAKGALDALCDHFDATLP